MPINKSKHINLLPQDDFQSTTLGRILKWALSTFRAMVIVTELVVMGAFLSRFWLDAKNSDLNEELGIQKAQILAYNETEKEFKNYQQKLSIAKSIYQEDKNSQIIAQVVQQMPENLKLSSIQRTGDNLQIKANSLSEQSVAQFIKNLENLNTLSDINLSQVASSIDDSFVTTFTINATVKGLVERKTN